MPSSDRSLLHKIRHRQHFLKKRIIFKGAFQEKCMTLTDNQKLFLQQQLSLWAGVPVDTEMPEEYAALILGLSEAELAASDCRGNKDFQHNPLFWSGRLLEPVVNQWLRGKILSRYRKKGGLQPLPRWPGGKKFAACLTHDVDLVNFKSLPAQVRHLQATLKAGPRGKAWYQNSLKSLAKLGVCVSSHLAAGRRPVRFEPWLELESRLGFRSTFFFFPAQACRYHPLDGACYRHRDRLSFEGGELTVAEFMRELTLRGWEVGLHGTYYSSDDSAELKRQKEQVERSLGQEIVSIRQHCLHYDILSTPRAQSQAGFKYDTTLGFNRVIGFRHGIALPFHHYDLEADQPLPLIQIPLHIQDGALMRPDNLDLAPEPALARAKELIDKVEETNGLVTLLWHPATYDEQVPGWFWVYGELLNYLAAKEVWVAPVREIGAWWEQRQQRLQQP
jgi:peptidoglycan/xylan/chitin deacetylase (PgdA/CDA1 family)